MPLKELGALKGLEGGGWVRGGHSIGGLTFPRRHGRCHSGSNDDGVIVIGYHASYIHDCNKEVKRKKGED